MGNTIISNTGKTLQCKELERTNLIFNNPTAIIHERDKLDSYLLKFYYKRKYSSSSYIYREDDTFSDIIQEVSNVLAPSRIGKNPYALGEMAIHAHAFQPLNAPGGDSENVRLVLKFTPQDEDGYLSDEELQMCSTSQSESLESIRNINPAAYIAISNLKKNLEKIQCQIDEQSTIRILGCNIGRNISFLKTLYGIFWNKPKICGYNAYVSPYFEYEIEGRFQGDRNDVFRTHTIISIKEMYDAIEVTMAQRANNKNKIKMKINNVYMLLSENNIFDLNSIREGTTEFNNHLVCYQGETG
jgi:hypothetical protein